MQGESSSFCSACHKVHLDVPVNKYRWLRGFNDYDNWQASGVSGPVCALVLYYPAKSASCADCCRPVIDSPLTPAIATAKFTPIASRRPIRQFRLQITIRRSCRRDREIPQIRIYHRGPFLRPPRRVRLQRRAYASVLPRRRRRVAFRATGGRSVCRRLVRLRPGECATRGPTREAGALAPATAR